MVDATADQINEIEDVIRQAREVKDPASKEARDLYKKAIRLADEYFKIKRPKEEVGEPEYDPNERAAQTIPTEENGEGKAKTKIGPSQFVWNNKPSAIWLAATKLHEYQHASNGITLLPLTEEERKGMEKLGWKKEDIDKVHHPIFTPNDVNEEEVIAYNAMLKAADKLGLTPEMIVWIKDKKKEFFRMMPKEKQEKYKKEEPWLGFFRVDDPFNKAVGMFELPKGTPVIFREGDDFILDQPMKIAALVISRFEGNYRKFFDLNPNLTLELSPLRVILFGPPEYGGKSKLSQDSSPIHLTSPILSDEGIVIDHIANTLEKPCPGGNLRIRHAYSECKKDGFWHVVEDDYYSCPPDGKFQKFRVVDTATTQPCGPGKPVPKVAGTVFKDLHGDNLCQAPKIIGKIVISECVNGFWENSTYTLYECLDGSKRIVLPPDKCETTSTPCYENPPATFISNKL